MKILSITAGAAGMYCGSCLRDNALAAELIAEGHDVVLLPLYTPTLTDELNVSADKVFFGGISVYLEQYVPFFRRSPKWIDSLWDSSLMLKLASRRSISTSPKMLGELTVSMLKGDDGFQRKEILKLLDWLKDEGPQDVISLPYTLLLGLAQPINAKSLVARSQSPIYVDRGCGWRWPLTSAPSTGDKREKPKAESSGSRAIRKKAYPKSPVVGICGPAITASSAAPTAMPKPLASC